MLFGIADTERAREKHSRALANLLPPVDAHLFAILKRKGLPKWNVKYPRSTRKGSYRLHFIEFPKMATAKRHLKNRPSTSEMSGLRITPEQKGQEGPVGFNGY